MNDVHKKQIDSLVRAGAGAAERIATIRKLRSRKTPVSYREIGRQMNLSAAYVRKLALGLPSSSKATAPLAAPRRYRCGSCSRTFESKAKLGPDRCARCGSYDWSSDPLRHDTVADDGARPC